MTTPIAALATEARRIRNVAALLSTALQITGDAASARRWLGTYGSAPDRAALVEGALDLLGRLEAEADRETEQPAQHMAGRADATTHER